MYLSVETLDMFLFACSNPAVRQKHPVLCAPPDVYANSELICAVLRTSYNK